MTAPRTYCDHGKVANRRIICRECHTRAMRFRNVALEVLATHAFPLRTGMVVTINLPKDLNADDVRRITCWLSTLPLPEDPSTTTADS